MVFFNIFKRREEPTYVVKPPAYSVKEICTIFREIAPRYGVTEAYLNIPPMGGVDNYYPEKITLVYRHGKKTATMRDVHSLRGEVRKIFGDQVIPYPSGPNEDYFNVVASKGYKIL